MNNGLFGMFGGLQNFMSQFNQFRQNIQQNGLNPQQQVYTKAQQMMDSGKMTQDQYNQILNTAGMIRRFFG